MPPKGLLIAFEGNEGSGKSTQARRLQNTLTDRRHQSILIHEPGSTPLGDHLRTYLKEKHPITPMAELLLFAAARAQLVTTVIRPSLDAGTHVLADRFLASSVAYQGHGRQLDLTTVDQINAAATAGLVPDITFWLDIDPAAGIARADAEMMIHERRPAARRFEDMPLDFHERVSEGYQQQSTDPTWHRIDALLPELAIAADIADTFLAAASKTHICIHKEASYLIYKEAKAAQKKNPPG